MGDVTCSIMCTVTFSKFLESMSLLYAPLAEALMVLCGKISILRPINLEDRIDFDLNFLFHCDYYFS